VVTAKFDLPALERSLKKAAKAFGETSAQAVIRWGVSVCRDLAVQTQVFGKRKGGRPKSSYKPGEKIEDKQINSLMAGAMNVLLIVPKVGAANAKGLRSAGEVNNWIESNRGKRGRTPKLPLDQRRVCTQSVFDSAFKQRIALAGIAKGAWLGAGMELSKHEAGTARIGVGKNFLGYTQKHASRGHAVPAKSGFSPVAILENKAAHSASSWVLNNSSKRDAVAFGARKTITWYRKALKAKLDKV